MSTATTLTSDERRALQMWFRHAIAEVEKKEALEAITRFYNGEPSTKHNTHKSHQATRRSPRTRGTRTHELV